MTMTDTIIETQPVLIEVKKTISSLSVEDRKMVREAYYSHFNKNAPNRFNNIMFRSVDFNVPEKRFLSKLFVIVNDKPILNYNHQIFDQLEKPLETE